VTGGDRPGRLSRQERRSALAAPADADGFTSRWYWIRGQRLHVRQRPPTDPDLMPCILLHGVAVSHRYLMPTARRLGQRAVYVPDMLGFGLSDKPTTVFDVSQHAEVLATWLDSIGTPPAAVLGNSFGCQVAVELASRRPDLVASLILVGPTTDPRAASMPAQAARLVRTLPGEDWRQAKILRADIRDAGTRRIVTTLSHAVRDHIEAKLAGIRVPTLLVRGARDRIAPQPWLDRAAALTPFARTLVIEGAAHNAATTAGPELGAAIATFLTGRPRTAAEAGTGAACPPRPMDRSGSGSTGSLWVRLRAAGRVRTYDGQRERQACR
jgi:pimeloyl-ACP methyl ester carboxylesterase